jgi:hypothetical protein
MSGHTHMPHIEHHSSGPDEHLWRFRVEIVIAVLLGLAAIVGATAAYFGHVAEGHAVKSYNQAVRASNDSAFFYNQGNARFVQYQAIFLEYAKDAYQGTKTNDYTFPAYIQTTLMDDTLSKMVTWWTKGDNTKKYHSPFVDADPYYAIPEYTKAAALDKQTAENFAEGKKDENKSNRYTLVEVLIASALFLYGIASVTRRFSIKLGFLAVGFVLFTLSVVQLSRVRWG